MAGLYRVELHKVAELTHEETEAVLDNSEWLDDPYGERFVTLDFTQGTEDDAEAVEDFRASVRPEVFEAVKRIGNEEGTFIIVRTKTRKEG